MPTDQAAHLRSLMRENTHSSLKDTQRIPLIGLMGGKAGVGTSALACVFAYCMKQAGKRVILVDLDLQSPSIHRLLQREESNAMTQVLLGVKQVSEVLENGPAEIPLVLNEYPKNDPDAFVIRLTGLMHQLRKLSSIADCIILDLGTGCSTAAMQAIHYLDQLAVVSTADDVSIMDSYGAIKRITQETKLLSIGTLVNRVGDPFAARRVHVKIAECAESYLETEVNTLGTIGRETRLNSWLQQICFGTQVTFPESFHTVMDNLQAIEDMTASPLENSKLVLGKDSN